MGKCEQVSLERAQTMESDNVARRKAEARIETVFEGSRFGKLGLVLLQEAHSI
jgi:hypothetical protein